MELIIREYQVTDDLGKLTELIHSAYEPHAASGLRYWGTYQTIEDTKRRISMGICLIALLNGEYIGTAVFRRPQPDSPVELFRCSSVWTLSQFSVAPKYKGQSYGKAIHSYGLQLLKNMGVSTLALDTAEPAKALIKMYQFWGYKLVGTCDWRPTTNYPSVVMSLQI
jgi:GNAT superfamily N-acetyltransferase